MEACASPNYCPKLQGEFPFSRPSDHTAINAAARMQMQFHRILRAEFHIKKLYVRRPPCGHQISLLLRHEQRACSVMCAFRRHHAILFLLPPAGASACTHRLSKSLQRSALAAGA